MDVQNFSDQMASHAQAITHLASGVSDEQARWKPDAGSWSILEVINHLLDEERLDFRVRLEIILRGAGEDWPPINPQGWVTERAYNQRDLAESLASFLAEREKSLQWLASLGQPDFSILCRTAFGEMAAGDMFAAWVAHDLLHLRQLVELHYAYTVQAVQPYSPLYAGDW